MKKILVVDDSKVITDLIKLILEKSGYDCMVSNNATMLTQLLGEEKFDLILYVPPTKSGELVKNFAIKISQVLKFPISHNLRKQRQTSEQKVFENSYLKADNVRDAFTYNNPTEIEDKSILLIDDIFDSGATVKEIGKYLINLGAKKIAPLVIARTLGGDLK